MVGRSRKQAFGERDYLMIVKGPTHWSLSVKLSSALLLACVNGKWCVFSHTDCPTAKDEGHKPLFIFPLMASGASA